MGLLKLPIFMYACFKEALTRMKIAKDQPDLIILLSTILTFAFAPIVLSILTALNIFKQLVNLYLQQTHQENYRGMMDGIDTVCCSQKNCVPSVIAFVDYRDSLESLTEAVKEQLKRLMATRHEKMFYSRSTFMGYSYYYRKYIPPSGYVSLMENTGEAFLTRKKFAENLMPYDSAPLPEDDAALFEVLICPQKVLINDQQLYAITYRIHHCVSDARSILHLFKGVMADKRDDCYGHTSEINGRVRNPQQLTTDSFRNFLTNVTIKEFPMTTKDNNVLRGFNLCEEKFYVWYSDRGTDSMDKIRKLRKSVNGLTFLDVINTCLSSSLYDYYKKIEAPIPKSIIGGVVLSPEIVSYKSYGIQDFNLINRFSAASFTLPIDVNSEHENKLIARMRLLKKEYDVVKRSFDIQFNYWCAQHIMTKIPLPIITFMSTFLEISVGISSLPGCDEFNFYGGNPVKEFLLFPPNSPGTGLHTVIYTYKGHLRISLTADKSVIPNYEGAQEIVDGMISHLDDLSSICSEDLKLHLS